MPVDPDLIEELDRRMRTNQPRTRKWKEAETMLQEHPELAQVRLSQGDTPLHRAVDYRHPDLVNYLLEQGADIQAKNEANDTPFNCALYLSTGLYEDGIHSLAVLEALIHAGADIKSLTGWTLHHALSSPQGSRALEYFPIVQLLLRQGAPLAQLNSQGYTSLHTWTHYPDVMRILVSYGADVNARTEEGYTPLLFAAETCPMESVQTLVELGADIGVRDESRKTLLHCAATDRSGAAKVDYLLRLGVDFHLKDQHGNTPLHLAALERNEESVRLLLAAGADVNALNRNRRTPLAMIANWKRYSFYNPPVHPEEEFARTAHLLREAGGHI